MVLVAVEPHISSPGNAGGISRRLINKTTVAKLCGKKAINETGSFCGSQSTKIKVCSQNAGLHFFPSCTCSKQLDWSGNSTPMNRWNGLGHTRLYTPNVCAPTIDKKTTLPGTNGGFTFHKTPRGKRHHFAQVLYS